MLQKRFENRKKDSHGICVLDQACSVKMAGYGPLWTSFFAFLWTDTKSGSIKRVYFGARTCEGFLCLVVIVFIHFII